MKRMIAVLLSALLLCTAAACASGGDASDDASFEAIDPAALPSKVDLRDYDGKNYVTSVKSQRFGDCWSFSLAGAAEIAYLFANDMGVPAGEINDRVDFSEKYIVWYLFHGITANDVLKGKVRASQVGEGFDPSEAERSRELTPYLIGGPYVHDANLFGSGFGPVDESVAINGEYPYAYDDEWTGEWSLPLNAEYRNPPVNAYLRNSIILPCPAEIDENGKYTFNAAGLNAIKSEISKGHGVSLAFSTSGGYNAENKAVYHGAVTTADHAVVCVGYDDDYPKENFTVTYNTEKGKEESAPPGNGAFILKNSWGIIDSEEDGFFYLSYYDQSIVSPLSYVFDDTQALRHTDVNYDQYDLMMTNWYGCTEYDAETKTANVFDAEEDETLYQIAYRTGTEMTEVRYEIYRDCEDDDPSSGTLLEKGVKRHSFAGFYKIDLKDEYPLKQGEKYAVVLTMQRVTDEDGGAVYTEVYPYSTAFYQGMTVTGIVNPGESYLYTDGKWTDLSRLKHSMIERAYPSCEKIMESDQVIPGYEWKGKDSMTVDNYPIKAILAPAG